MGLHRRIAFQIKLACIQHNTIYKRLMVHIATKIDFLITKVFRKYCVRFQDLKFLKTSPMIFSPLTICSASLRPYLTSSVVLTLAFRPKDTVLYHLNTIWLHLPKR